MTSVLSANQADCGDTSGTSAGWWASGDEATISSSTAAYRSSPRSILLTATGTNTVFAYSDEYATDGWTCAPGDVVNASGWSRRASGTTGGDYLYVVIDWFTSGGTLISSATGSIVALTSTFAQSTVVDAVAPATTGRVGMRLASYGTITAGQAFHWDDITLDLVAAASDATVTCEDPTAAVTAAGALPVVKWEQVVSGGGSAAVTVAAPAPTVTGDLADVTVTVPATSAVTAAMNMPTITAGDTVVPSALAMVQVEFTAGTWTDVTSWWDAARPITMTAGRSDVDDRVQPGRLSGLVLDNTDGRFTVGNSAGAYTPNVVSGKRVRVSIKDPTSNTYIPRFTGRIDGWPLEWADNGTTCWVTLSATDMLTDWAQADMPPDYMYQRTADLVTAGGSALTDYWECTSLANDGTMANSVAGGAPLVNSGAAPTTFSGAALPGDPRPAIQYAGGGWYSAGRVGAQDSNSWSVFGWLRLDGAVESGNTTGYYLVTFDAMPAHRNLVVLRVTSTTLVLSTLNLSTGAWDDILTNTVDLSDKSWHTFRLVVTESGGSASVSLYVDNTAASSSSGVTTDNMLANTWPRSMRLGTYARGTVAHVSYWEGRTGLTNQTLAAAAAGITGTPADVRLERIADYCGLSTPTVVGDLRAGLVASPPAGKALDLTAAVVDTDGGVLWCDGAGTVTYVGGGRRTAGTTLALTVTTAEVDPSIQVAADKTDVVNVATIKNHAPLSDFRPDPTTTTLTVSDTASTAGTGVRPKELTTYWYSTGDPGYLQTRAAELLSTTEAPRIPTLPFDALTLTAAQQSTILGTGVWDQIGVTGLPTAGGWDTTWLGRIEGWTETLGASEWRVTFNTSFAGNRLGDATHGLILGASRLG